MLASEYGGIVAWMAAGSRHALGFVASRKNPVPAANL